MESDLDKSEKVPVQPSDTENAREEVKKDAQGLLESVKRFLYDLLDFRNDTDQNATVEAIKSDIPLKGATAWILVCSIFIASIGLNANSTAVVIGAMLISPLMGPILGIGLSIAINDIDTLRKSLSNLATMIVLSLLTAFLFFALFPLSEDTSELLGRVRPDIRDVLIAFFGGLALIIARTKKGTIASVIFGVAIATALMPPLCTAGYGLAKGNWEYFRGAMYLFIINTIFIALATFLVLKLLGFTMMRYVNSAKRKRIAQIASLIAVVVMIPAILTFLKVYNESKVSRQVNDYLNDEIRSNAALQLIDHDFDPDTKELSLNFFNEITQPTLNDLNNELTNEKNYPNLKGVKLKIKGGNVDSYKVMSTLYTDTREELKESRNIIKGLQKEIEDLQGTITKLNERIEKNENSVAFSKVAKEAKIRYSGIEKISFAKMLTSKDFIKIDTLSIATVEWSKKLSRAKAMKKQRELHKWLQDELKVDTLFIKQFK